MKFNVSVLQAGLNHSPLCPLNHLNSEIYSNHSTLYTDPAGSQDDIYATATPEIDDDITRLEIRKACRVATTP